MVEPLRLLQQQKTKNFTNINANYTLPQTTTNMHIRVGWKWSSSRIQVCSPKIGCKSQKQAFFRVTTFFCIALILPNLQKTCFLFQWDFSKTQKLDDPKYWISHMQNNGLELTIMIWPTKKLSKYCSPRYNKKNGKIWPSKPNHHILPLFCLYLGLRYSDNFFVGNFMIVSSSPSFCI